MNTNQYAHLNLSIEEAISLDIKAFKGTEAELSVRVCGSKQALSHKKAGFRGSSFNIREVTEIQLNSGSRYAIHAMAGILGGVFLDLPEYTFDDECQHLHKRMTQITVRLGRLVDAVGIAQEKGGIDQRERQAILRLEQEVRTVMNEWIQLSFKLYPEMGDDNEA